MTMTNTSRDQVLLNVNMSKRNVEFKLLQWHTKC